MNGPYLYFAELVRVVDGDTVDLRIDLGFHLTHERRFRLYGIDTPEIRGTEKEAGTAAKNHLIGLLDTGVKVGARLKVLTHKGSQTDSFGRYLATLYLDHVNICDLMIQAGHAVVYIPK